MQVLGPDNLPTPAVASTTTVTLAATNAGQPTTVTIGGQGFALSSTLTLNAATTGANGLDSGALAASSAYYLYAIRNTSTFAVALIGSTVGPATGPTMPSGYGAAYKLVGFFNTNTSSNIVAASSVAIVSSGAAGVLPYTNNVLDNASATRLGLMQYLSSGSYSGAAAPTLSCSQSGSATTRGVFVPYQMNDGTWRLRFSIAMSFPSATTTSVNVTVTGIIFKNVSSYFQAVSGYYTGGPVGNVEQAYCNPNGGTLTLLTTSGSAAVGIVISGDVELDSKPTWAY